MNPLLLVILLAACSGSSTDTKDPDDESPDAQTQFANNLVDAACDRYGDCADPSALESYSVQQCKDSVSGGYATLAAYCTFNMAAAQACLDAIEAAPCEDYQSTIDASCDGNQIYTCGS